MRTDTHRAGFRDWRASIAQALVVAATWIALLSASSAQEARYAGSWLDDAGDLRSAFRDVIADARKCTVRIMIANEPIALGAIVEPDGWIVTKGSELKGSVRCLLPDGRNLPAEHRGYDRTTDLALLKVATTGLDSIRWRDAADPQVGDWLASAGQDAPPVAVGIVSVARREIPIQKVSGVLGIEMADGSDGVLIAEIIENSAAAAADLRKGDVILRIADRPIDGRSTLQRIIRENEPGTTLTIKVRRGDAELELPITLTHPFGQFLSRIAEQNHMGGNLSLRRTGFPAVLQHDTVLAPEDCGGPLVDLDGAAVGLNIARAGRTESYALPADVVIAAIKNLRSAAVEEPHLANESAPDVPQENSATSVDSGAQ